MSISCDCSTDAYDQPSAYRDVWRKARKQHMCCECLDPIEKGERYEYVSGVWDGNANSHKTCVTCVAIRERYCANGWIHTGLAQQIFDCIGFDYRVVPGEGDL